jgi:hypothetical protein
MRTLLSILSITAVATVLSAAAVHAQNCSCGGQTICGKFSDGDGNPLQWLYSASLVDGSCQHPVLVCYTKQVDNKSSSDVVDVRWKIAGFFRQIIPHRESRVSCVEVAGETKSAPTNGPLNFGTSSIGYETTVLEPKDGWGEHADATGPGMSPNPPPIRSQFAVDVRDRGGKPVLAQVTFSSTVRSVDGRTMFNYSVANDSNVDLGVLVNLSATPQILQNVPMFQKRLLLKARENRKFDVTTEGAFSVETAAVVIYDAVNQRISGIDSGGFYTIKGRKELPDDFYWQSIR